MTTSLTEGGGRGGVILKDVTIVAKVFWIMEQFIIDRLVIVDLLAEIKITYCGFYMIIDANHIENPATFKADICILGGGVAGIVIANELLESNKSVVLLESGSEHFDAKTQDLYKAEAFPKKFPDPHFSRLRFLGGSSNHWENSIERFDPIDLKKRKWVENSGWPLDYAELSYFYPKAEHYCGVGGDGYDFEFWKKKYGSKDLLSKSRLFKSVVSKSPLYPTQFFRKHGKELVSNTNVTVIKNANVVDLIYDNEAEKVESVAFRAFQKLQHTVEAKYFIMCMGGIENARMLLIFNEKYKGKLGDHNGNVGRYFMEHPTIRGAHFIPFRKKSLDQIYGGVKNGGVRVKGRLSLTESAQESYRTNNLRMYLVEQSKLTLSDGISSSHIVSDSFKEYELPENFGGHLLNIIKDGDHIAETFLKNEFDTSFFNDAYEFGGYQIVSMIEQTPDKNNRIKLGNEKDSLGLKKIHIDFRITQSDKDAAWKTLELLAKDQGILASGRLRLLKNRESRIWNSQLGFGSHHMGTTRMGRSVKDGVVDSSLKVFGTKNLFISGSSVFPTGGHVPPTLTVVAMSIRLARELREAV